MGTTDNKDQPATVASSDMLCSGREKMPQVRSLGDVSASRLTEGVKSLLTHSVCVRGKN